MSNYEITIKDREKGTERTIECDAMFAGYAGEDNNAGLFGFCNGSGLSMAIAANLAEEAIARKEKEDKMFALSRRCLKKNEDKILSRTIRGEEHE